MHSSMAAAQGASEASVVSSPSPNPNWWEIHANPIASWNSMNRPSWVTSSTQLLKNSNNSSAATVASDQEDVSNISTTSFINNAGSNHSGLTMVSSTAELSAESVDNHLWNQLLLSGAEMHNEGENFLNLLSSKSLASQMFDPAPPCDYLKKLDNNWEFNNQQNSINGLISRGLKEQPRPTINNQSDPVSNWSIAPPNPQLDLQFTSIHPSSSQYAMPNTSQIKHEIPSSPSTYTGNGLVGEQGSGGSYMSYLHDMKFENHQQQELGLTASLPSFLRPLNSSNNPTAGYHIGLSNSFGSGMMNSKYCNGVAADLPWCNNNTRNLSDLISFNSALSKAPMDYREASNNKTTPLKGPAEPIDNKKQAYETSQSSCTRGSGVRSPGTSSADGNKKKRAEDGSETISKKAKNESSSTVSSNKVPKVKLGEKITALQQIVSPFGKTDTASVLFEAIKYIQFLQEQVQLLSDPYMKSGKKDHNPWAGLEREEKTEQNQDLRSRGLCLVPIAYTPQACRENSGPDFWTPTYRGCMYR